MHKWLVNIWIWRLEIAYIWFTGLFSLCMLPKAQFLQVLLVTTIFNVFSVFAISSTRCSVIHIFGFGYTDKMPIIIIFDPSGSCVIFARSIFIIFCLHTKNSWYLHSYTATSIPILLPFTKQMWLMTYRSWILYHLLRFRTNRHICKRSDQKILYSIKVKSKTSFFL